MKRIGLFDDLSNLIRKTLEATDGESLSIEDCANQILLHTNFPDGNFDGEPVSIEERNLLSQFSNILWKEIIRKYHNTNKGIVEKIEAEIKATCAAKEWDWGAITRGFDHLREYEKSKRKEGETKAIQVPKHTTKEKKEVYLEWTRDESKLDRLAMILQKEENWILNQKDFIDLLSPNVTIQVTVRCNHGCEERLALLIWALRKSGCLQPRGSNGYFGVCQNCLVDPDGTVFEKNLRQLPTKIRKKPRTYSYVIDAVRRIFDKLSIPFPIDDEYS